MKFLISLIVASFLLLSNEPVSKTSDSRTISFVNPLHENAVVLSGFGLRTHPVLNKERMHNGIDFKASVGDPVHASASGTVTFADKKGRYGNLVEIQHEDGFVTRYSQLSEFHDGIQEGSEVESGQLIAFAGETGLATAPHLHFEILLEGEAKDPLLYLD